MPIIKSAIKRARQQEKRRSHNLQVKRAVHRDVRSVMDAISAGDAKQTSETLRAAISEIDRAAKKGTMHKNTAARQKSRLTKLANPVTGAVKTTAKKAASAKPATAKKATAKKASPKTKKSA